LRDTGWTELGARGNNWEMARDLNIQKLSDEFGQYILVLKCECGHERRADPHVLAKLCGWDARITEVVKRLRCSKCGKKKCTWWAFPASKPRGDMSRPR
jgi:hypothetical protein